MISAAKRKNNTLSRKTKNRPYRAVCWVSAEGKTEKDYFKMDVFGLDSTLQFVVERFGKLGGRLRMRRRCLWAWCPSAYRCGSPYGQRALEGHS